MRFYSNYSSQSTRRGRQSVIITLWQFCDTHYYVKWVTLEKFCEKNWHRKNGTEKNNHEMRFESHIRKSRYKCSQGQRSSLEKKKRPYHMENLGSFLITWKITNLYNSSHQVFLLLLCRTRALDRLHWFQIKYLAVRDRFAGSTHRTEDLSEDPRTDRFEIHLIHLFD